MPGPSPVARVRACRLGTRSCMSRMCGGRVTGWSAPAGPFGRVPGGQKRRRRGYHDDRDDRDRFGQDRAACGGDGCGREGGATAATGPGQACGVAGQPGAVPERHGGLRRSPSSRPHPPRPRPRCPADAGPVREAVRQDAQERPDRRRGSRRGGAATANALCADQDADAVGRTGAASGARPTGGHAHRVDQPDPRLSARAGAAAGARPAHAREGVAGALGGPRSGARRHAVRPDRVPAGAMARA